MTTMSGVSGPFANDPLVRVVNATASHAAATGLFGKVNGHEPKSPPSTGRNPDLTCSVWVQRIRRARSSGMDMSSVVLELNVRLYLPMKQEPQDMIDPTMLGAVDRLCAAYVGDFTFGGLARSIDVGGIENTPMSVDAGYVELSGVLYRVMTIVAPIIVNDIWTETA